MQVDAYQYCPCGSGKKIKFCKCADNFKDLDKIDRMISGGQLVAALDRINQLLQTNASAAWLLALKAQILFQLKEFEALSETANRFWRLKPDNQLALWLMTISETIRSPSSQVPAKYFLEGVAEIRDVVHPFGETAGLMLAERLAIEEHFLSALMIADLVTGLFKSETPAKFVDEISENGSVPLFLRVPPTPYEKAGSVPWNERYQEVRSLLKTHRITQAHAKLQSLNREFADQPVILSMLVVCELYRCDLGAAARHCERLSKIESLPFNDRVYYQSLAFLLAPEQTGVVFKVDGLLFDLTPEQEEKITHLLGHLSSIEVVKDPSEELRQEFAAFINEEVGPKSIYTSFSGLKVEVNGQAEEVPVSTAMLGIFGRQTDHPARLLVRYPLEMQRSAGQVDELLGSLNLERSQSKFEQSAPIFLDANAIFNFYVHGAAEFSPKSEEEVHVMTARLRAVTEERFKLMTFSCLDGKCAAEVSGSPQYAMKIRALLLTYLTYSDQRLTYAMYDKLLADLQLTPQEKYLVSESAAQISPANLFFIDVPQLPARIVVPVASYALQMRITTLYPAISERLSQGGLPEEHQPVAEEIGIMMRLSTAIKVEDRVDLIDKLVALRAAANKPVGPVIVSGINALSEAGLHEAANELLKKYMRKYPEDPYLLAFLQQVLAYSAQMGRPIPSTVPLPQQQETEGGLWIPGQSAPSEPSSAGGGSKLWIPGMD
jgi:hypothetical protein